MEKDKKTFKSIFDSSDQVFLWSGVVLFTLSLLSLIFVDKIFYLKKDIDPSQILGKVTEVKGDIKRKFMTDISFRPISKGDPIVAGDTIFANNNSVGQITLSSKSKLYILENSLIYFEQIGEQLSLEIEQGNLKVEMDPQDKILIKTDEQTFELDGSEYEEATIAKGKKPYKKRQSKSNKVSENADLDKATISSDLKDTKNAPAKRGVAGIDRKFNYSEDFKASKLDKSKNYSEIRLDPPYPKEGTLFLLKNKDMVYVQPEEICESQCALEIWNIEKKIITRVNFAAGEKPIAKIPIDDSATGEVRWNYSTPSNKRSGTFFIKKFNKENLSYGIKNSKKVEVLN